MRKKDKTIAMLAADLLEEDPHVRFCCHWKCCLEDNLSIDNTANNNADSETGGNLQQDTYNFHVAPQSSIICKNY